MDKIDIMVVEDESIAAEDIRMSLLSLGYSVSAVVGSGTAALTKTKELQPNLVLMDIKLQGNINGVEAAHRIRSQFDIPVVYLTAFADVDTLEKVKLTEPYGFIFKPFEDSELHAVIETALYKHRMEKEIREKEAWLSTTLQSIGDAVIATDKNGKITFMNPVAEKLTGWQEEDSKGKALSRVFKVIDADTGRRIIKPVERVLSNGSVMGLGLQTMLIAKDESHIPIDCSSAPIRDQQGNILGVVLVFKDITERKRPEEALRKNEERFRTLIESSSDVIHVVDTEGILQYVSPSVKKVLGYKQEDLTGDPGLAIIHPVDLKLVKEKYRKARRTPNKAVEVEYRCKHKDGSWRRMEGTVINHLNNPVINGFISNIHDITNRVGAEEALRASEKKFRYFFEKGPEYCYMVSSEGVILDINGSALKALEYKKQELAGKPLKSIYAPESLKKAEQLFKKWKNTGKLKDEELIIISKNGKKKRVLLSATAVKDKNGKVIHSLSVQREITKR